MPPGSGAAIMSAMNPLRVLFANDPRSYREAIAGAMSALMPQYEVFVSEPEGLDEEMLLLKPGLVVCSKITAVVRALAPCWVELYPDGQGLANVWLGDGLSVRREVDLPELLSIAGAAEFLGHHEA